MNKDDEETPPLVVGSPFLFTLCGNKGSSAHHDSSLIWSGNAFVHLPQGEPQDEHLHCQLYQSGHM